MLGRGPTNHWSNIWHALMRPWQAKRWNRGVSILAFKKGLRSRYLRESLEVIRPLDMGEVRARAGYYIAIEEVSKRKRCRERHEAQEQTGVTNQVQHMLHRTKNRRDQTDHLDVAPTIPHWTPVAGKFWERYTTLISFNFYWVVLLSRDPTNRNAISITEPVAMIRRPIIYWWGTSNNWSRKATSSNMLIEELKPVRNHGSPVMGLLPPNGEEDRSSWLLTGCSTSRGQSNRVCCDVCQLAFIYLPIE